MKPGIYLFSGQNAGTEVNAGKVVPPVSGMLSPQNEGDEVLAEITHDLVEAIRGSVTIDWTQKEAVRADMRRKVKRLLRKHVYPPDKREEAVITVIEQAETLCRDWAESPPGGLLSNFCPNWTSCRIHLLICFVGFYFFQL